MVEKLMFNFQIVDAFKFIIIFMNKQKPYDINEEQFPTVVSCSIHLALIAVMIDLETYVNIKHCRSITNQTSK